MKCKSELVVSQTQACSIGIVNAATDTVHYGVYLSVKTCEVCLCFVAIVRIRVYYVDFFNLYSLFYVTGECHRFLHRG